MSRRPTSLLRETLLALVALALLALNFGHTSAVFAAEGRVVITSTSICGDPLAPAGGEHFACHACRPAAIDLPPAPCGIEPVVFSVQTVAYVAAPEITTTVGATIVARPRGPPAV
ncbi:MAG: hypothetical protein ABI697_12935 [Devosia sp.]